MTTTQKMTTTTKMTTVDLADFEFIMNEDMTDEEYYSPKYNLDHHVMKNDKYIQLILLTNPTFRSQYMFECMYNRPDRIRFSRDKARFVIRAWKEYDKARATHTQDK